MDYPDQLKRDRANQLKDDNYKSSPENDEDASFDENAPYTAEQQRDELLSALHRMIVSTNSAGYCYDRVPGRFAEAFTSLKHDANVANGLIKRLGLEP